MLLTMDYSSFGCAQRLPTIICLIADPFATCIILIFCSQLFPVLSLCYLAFPLFVAFFLFHCCRILALRPHYRHQALFFFG